jgi:DNA repair protein RecO (recombination protein O)
MPRSERTLRVEAIILQHSDWGEADRILRLFTREQGKLRAIAKGARKMRSRKAGHLEPFMRSKLMLAKGRDMWIVTQAEVIEPYNALRENLEATARVAYVIELLDRLTYEEGPNWQLYDLVVKTLERLMAQPDPFVPLHYYEMRLLDLTGYRPLLFECAVCRKKIEAEDQFFSAELGGVLCPACGARTAGSRMITMDTLRYLRHFQRSTYAESLRADPPAKTRAEVEVILNYYLTYLLERGLNSTEFLNQIRA